MNFLNHSDARFVKSRKVLDAKMKKLISEGIGVEVKQADPVLPDQENKLWEEGVFGNQDAESLQYTVLLKHYIIFKTLNIYV